MIADPRPNEAARLISGGLARLLSNVPPPSEYDDRFQEGADMLRDGIAVALQIVSEPKATSPVNVLPPAPTDPEILAVLEEWFGEGRGAWPDYASTQAALRRAQAALARARRGA